MRIEVLRFVSFHTGWVQPRICSSHLLRLVNPCCNACVLLTPVIITGSQRKTIGTFVPYLFPPPDETKLLVARVVVYDTILLLNISTDMPASHRQNGLRQRRKACSEIINLNTAESYNSLQLRVSLRFASPRYDAYCKIRLKNKKGARW